MDIPDLVTGEEELAHITIPPVVNDYVPPSTTEEEAPAKKIPITIITGYLGSGKSTLLERIGRTSNKRLAIILNEFGDLAAIEKSVTIQDESEAVQEWLDLGNGCLCCTVKDNGVVAIENLIETSRGKIDYILLETTGVADPAPIAKMFWLDDALASSVYIDGVVTVVDGENIIQCLDDVGGHWHRQHNHIRSKQSETELTPAEIEQEEKQLAEGLTTAHLQIALADTILINKVDKISASQVEAIGERVRGINTTSPIHTTSYGDIALDKILDLHAFEGERLAQSLTYAGTLFHDDRISTVSITFPFFTKEEEFQKAEAFIQNLLWEGKVNGHDVEVHRLKGLLARGPDVRVVQGVRETYEIREGGRLAEGIDGNKFVFIGKNLKEAELREELLKYIE